MKKLYVLVFMLLFLSISSCSTKEEIIYLYTDKFKSLAEESFIYNMKKLNVNFKSVNIENDNLLLDYFNDLSDRQLKNNVFVISEGFSNVDISNKVNNYIYINNKNNPNLNNLDINQKEVSYLLGVISGVITRKNEVSIVYSKNLSDYNDNLTSFINGLKEVNLRAYDYFLDGKNLIDVDSINIGEISSYVSGDIVFNLSNQELGLNDNIVLSLNMDDSSRDIIEILYKYDDFLENVRNNKGLNNFTISIYGGSIEFNLTNLPKEVLDIFQSYLDKI